MAAKLAYSLGELSRLLNVDLRGDPAASVTGLAPLANAGPGHLSSFHNRRYYKDLLATRATAVILHADYLDKCPVNALLSDHPYIAFAKASHLFEHRHNFSSGIHPSAVIHETARVAPSAVIDPHVVIGQDASIGENVRIGANCSISGGSSIGADGVLYPNVTIYPNVRVGKWAVIHSGAVIGSDGFGFALTESGYVKISQLGGVVIGDDVEIGAGSCIDRGALEDTVIGDGVKIDNQVQIAHNVKIGDHTVICGCSAIAGSSSIGKNCTIAGGVGIINHLEIADGVTVTAMSLVNRSIRGKGVYSSGTGLTDTATWRRNMLRFGRLDEMAKRLRRLERALRALMDRK